MQKSLELIVGAIARNPAAILNSHDTSIVLRTVEKTQRSDLRYGAGKLIEILSKSLDLSFCGVYINNGINVNVELDPATRQVIYGRASELEQKVVEARQPTVITTDTKNKLVLPISYHGKRFGAAVFEKTSFSEHDLATLIYTVKLFSHYVNIARKLHLSEDEKMRDYLTGVYNRRKMDADLKHAIKQAREHKRPLSLIVVDADHFKSVNETYGHLYGDCVLITIAQLLLSNVRASDIVYRYGGEEFVILLPGTPIEEASNIARRINDDVREHYFTQKLDPEVIKKIYFGRANGANDYFTEELPPEIAEKRYWGRLNSHQIRVSMGVASTDTNGYVSAKGFKGSAKRLFVAADTNLSRAKVFRNSVCDGKPVDVYTGLPEIPRDQELQKQISQCRRNNGNIAIVMYDALRFSEAVHKLGNERAWQMFSEAAHYLQQQLPKASWVARGYDSDRLVAAFYSETEPADFEVEVRQTALNTLASLKEFVGSREPFYPLDFAAGVLVYSPKLISPEENEKLNKNPALLLSSVQPLVIEAGDLEQRLLIKRY